MERPQRAPPPQSGIGTGAAGLHACGSTPPVCQLHIPPKLIWSGPDTAELVLQLLHRRAHLGLDKVRPLPQVTADAPSNLSSATPPPPCVGCAQAKIKRVSHSGTLSTPDQEPGVLMYDLKELVVSLGGYPPSSS